MAELSKRPFVSIVIPTYNRATLLPWALDACLEQTFRDLEIIVVNDGSRDNTREVLDRYQARDSRLRAIHKDNEGIPDTVNRGFAEARGRYVTWTSDDNRYHPDAIQTMVEFMEAHPDVSMCYTDVNDVDATGTLLGRVDTGAPELLDPNRPDCYCGIRGCLLFRHEVLEAVGPWERRWIRCHDFDFYIRIYRRFKVAHIPVAVYDYMCHDASMTGNYEAIALEESELIEHYCPGADQHVRIWAPRYIAIARWFEKRGEWWRALGYCRKAARLDPAYRGLARQALRVWLYGLAPVPVRQIWRSVKSLTGYHSNGGAIPR